MSYIFQIYNESILLYVRWLEIQQCPLEVFWVCGSTKIMVRTILMYKLVHIFTVVQKVIIMSYFQSYLKCVSMISKPQIYACGTRLLYFYHVCYSVIHVVMIMKKNNRHFQHCRAVVLEVPNPPIVLELSHSI